VSGRLWTNLWTNCELIAVAIDLAYRPKKLTSGTAISYTQIVMRQGNADLVLISIRLHKRDVKAAKAEAKRLAVPYQVLIRQWVAEKIEAVGDRRESRAK